VYLFFSSTGHSGVGLGLGLRSCVGGGPHNMSALGRSAVQRSTVPAVRGGENGVHRAGLAPVDADLSEKTLPVRLFVDKLSGRESGEVQTLPALLRRVPASRTDGVPRRHGDDDGDILCDRRTYNNKSQPA